MNKTLAKYFFFFPVRLLRGEDVAKYWRIVESVERLSYDEIQDYQWGEVQKVLRFIYKNIPYYKKVFSEAQITPDDIKTRADFSLIPPLTKKDIQQNKELLINPKVRHHSKRSTSGSSGTPLKFYKDRFSTACMDAVMYHAYTWHGIKLGAPQARFWGMPWDKKAKSLAQVKDFLMNRKRLSAFALNEEEMDTFYLRLKKFSPEYFYGYPSLIYEFARFINEAQKDIGFLNLKGIIGTGELIVPAQREYIEDVFNCKFISEYGCTETGVIGFDCPEGNMHLMAHNIFLEVINDGESVIGKKGNLLITELNFQSFPFIRYEINDIGGLSRERCSCGSGLPVIDIMSGRTDSYIYTPSGKKVYDAILAYTLKEGILSFRATQTKISEIEIYAVVDDTFDDILKNKYVHLLKENIDEGIDFVFLIVDELPREKSGKLRYFSSHISSESAKGGLWTG